MRGKPFFNVYAGGGLMKITHVEPAPRDDLATPVSVSCRTTLMFVNLVRLEWRVTIAKKKIQRFDFDAEMNFKHPIKPLETPFFGMTSEPLAKIGD